MPIKELKEVVQDQRNMAAFFQRHTSPWVVSDIEAVNWSEPQYHTQPVDRGGAVFERKQLFF